MLDSCSIRIFIPLERIPDDKKRREFAALYQAKMAWQETTKKTDEPIFNKDYDNFISGWPGVPFERTSWHYSKFGGDREVKEGKVKDGDLKPDSEQWNRPTIKASFTKVGNYVYVHNSDTKETLATSPLYGPVNYALQNHSSSLPLCWTFDDSFPIIAQLPFAGAKKIYEKKMREPLKDQSEKYYKAWFKKYGFYKPYLIWEHPVSKIIENLKYAIGIYENFPVKGYCWQWVWVSSTLEELGEMLDWYKDIFNSFPEAIAQLEWADSNWVRVTYDFARENNEPNEELAKIKSMQSDSTKLNEGIIFQNEFNKKYAVELKSKNNHGYIPILDRSRLHGIQR